MKIVMRKVVDLVPNEENPRHISDGELQKLVNNINEFGFVDPVIINVHDSRKNVIVGGHQRVMAAKLIGMEEIPTVEVSLEKEKEVLLNLSLNKISGDWDTEVLKNVLVELEGSEVDVSLSGFEDEEISKLLKEEEPVPEPDDVEEVAKLGKHVVECPKCKHKFKREEN